jgi:hypothetical protein
MDHSNDSVGVYAEAKGEYTKQLTQFLSQPIFTFFLKLLETAKEREADPKKLLLSFQILLEGISEWNHDKVQRETQNIAMGTQCDYLEELLTAVFVAHTKVLSSIRLTNKQKRLQITIPKLEHFLHKTLIECARFLWTNTYLFSSSCTAIEKQKNMRHVESFIGDGIAQGIRLMLPVKSILREYLSTEESDHDDSEEEEEEEEEHEEEEEEEVETPSPVESSGPVKEEKAADIDTTAAVTIDNSPVEAVATAPAVSSNNIVNHTFSPDTTFNPDRFDVFADIPSPPSRPKTPVPSTPAKEELPIIEMNTISDIEDRGIMSDDIMGNEIEFEEL